MTTNAKRIVLWVSVILGMVLMIVGLSKLGTSSASATTLSRAVNDGDMVKGPGTAKVTVVEYSDFQCPACSQYYPMVKRLAEDFPTDVRVVYRHYPLKQIHKNAEAAAWAAEAAGKQGKFWDMHDMLFNTQNDWSALENPHEHFDKLVASLGIDTEQYKKDRESNAVKDKVSEDLADALKMRLRGTPSFFINGTYTENFRSYEELKSLVSAKINE